MTWWSEKYLHPRRIRIDNHPPQSVSEKHQKEPNKECLSVQKEINSL